MSKLVITTLVSLMLLTSLKSQVDTTYLIALKKSDYYTKVHGFIPHSKKDATRFYDKPDGEVIGKIEHPGKWSWICLTVASDSGSWAKLESVKIAPGKTDRKYEEFRNTWIPIEDIWLDLSDGFSHIYESPNTTAVYRKVPFQTVVLIGVAGNWAKIRFRSSEETIIGWVAKESQCGYPWTTCSY